MFKGWRRWKPKQAAVAVVAQEHIADDRRVWERVERRIAVLKTSRRPWRQHGGVEWLEPLIQSAKDHAYRLDTGHESTEERADAWLYALVLQAPRAAVAQESMDEHPQGYHNKEKRLFELIDFNDAFVAAVLALPDDELPYFPTKAKQLLDTMCKKAGTRCFSNEQWSVIVHGLSREIAVYRGVQQEGFAAEMTSRASDAFGIDMRITDSKTLRVVNVDIKTRSAYHYRIHDLFRDGRLSEEELLMAERRGFVRVYNSRNGEPKVPVVIWSIDHEVLGEIRDFTFLSTQALGEMLRAIIVHYGDSRG